MNFYDKNAKEYIANTINANMNENYSKFLKYAKNKGRLLDLGCGSGRDSFYFQSLGFHVDGLEPSHEICKILKMKNEISIIETSIQEFVPIEKYEYIWACASLLHLKKDEFFSFFENLNDFLLTGGILYFSGKKGIKTGISKDGRYFLEFSNSLLDELFLKNKKIKLLEKWESKDVTGRQGFTWLNVIIRLEV